jgi:Fe-S-cluster containining protein
MTQALTPGQVCATCGACCAYYRVSFYWGETTASAYGTVPVELTSRLTDHRAVMIGTERTSPRCIALRGTVGDQVSCSIYDSRSTTCRDLKVSWQDGEHNPHCDKARTAYGLPVLAPTLFAADNDYTHETTASAESTALI